jgi:hypothetical protein
MFCNADEIKSIMTETDNGKPNNEEFKESDYEKKCNYNHCKNIKYINIFSQLSLLLIGNGFEVQTFESPTSM